MDKKICKPLYSIIITGTGLLRFIVVIRPMSQYITIKQASTLLGVSPLTLRNWDKSGKFPAMRHPMNNYRVYRLTDLQRILDDIELGGEAKSNARKKIRKLMVRSED